MKQKLRNLEKEMMRLQKDGLSLVHLEATIETLKRTTSPISTWESVERARSHTRPNSMDAIQALFTGFVELHGDRLFGDDGAICGGLAYLGDIPVTVIGIVKGKNTQENIRTNFGMVHPEGYRKALRLMKQAEKFNRPIITLIDTPGAYCGIEAEERGQGEAIAQNVMQMMDLAVPTITVILGEAGSGGALALAVSDRVIMFEHAIYCLLSPEGFASILFKDVSLAAEVADMMKITASDLLKMGVIDEIVSESVGFDDAFSYLTQRLHMLANDLLDLKPHSLKQRRYERYRAIGDVIHES